MAFLADGAYLLYRPGGRRFETFTLPHRDLPDLWQWKLRLRRAGPGLYLWASRELVYSAEIPETSRRLPLSRSALALAALWTAFVRPSLPVWKKVLKGLLRSEVRDWEDALVLGWTVGVQSNSGTVVGAEVCFDGARVPLVSSLGGTLGPGDRFALVAHWEPHEGVSAQDRRSWAFLRSAGYQVIVASTSMRPNTAADLPEVSAWVVRPNVGHDFLSWRAALAAFPQILAQGRYLVFTNGSAEIRDCSFIAELESWKVPLATVTGSLQIFPHAESYFWLVDLSELGPERLSRFLDSVQAWPEKRQLIHRGEIGFSRFLAAEGLGFRALYPYDRVVAALRAQSGRYPREWAHWQQKDPINPSKKLHAVLRDLGAPVLKKKGAFP